MSPLGSGGMGEVYRAHDKKLNRDVAVKVLPESLSKNADALSRFEREAHAVAALNHPNILSIFDFGSHEETAYAVMELLEGETLREILSNGPLSNRKTTDFARQISAGLAAAHGKGIVHRDLKPDNVFVTDDGRVKILDFGLAKEAVKSVPNDQTHSPTVSAYTEPGTVMGTVGYMSPEQVKGQAVDSRSDIFSFGAVLYEMATGKRAFQRETAAETMTAILREDPPELADAGKTLSPALDRIVRHCLEKKPEQRFQSASDIGFALEDVSTSRALSGAAASRGSRSTESRAVSPAVALLALLAGLLAGAGIWSRLRRPAAVEPIRVHALTFSGKDGDPSASPDGRLLAFTSWRDGTSRIWIKQFVGGGGEAPLTAGPDQRARFSPDGTSLLFLRDLGSTRAVYRVGIVGGEPRRLIDDASEADWSPDGRKILYYRNRHQGPRASVRFGVFDIDAGRDSTLAEINDLDAYSARWSPDGSRVAFSGGDVNRNSATWRLLQIDAATGKVSPLGPDRLRKPVGGIAWSGDGRSVFFVEASSVVGDIAGSGSRVFRLDLASNKETPILWAEGLANINASAGEVTRCDVLSPGRLVFTEHLRRQNLREVELRPSSPPTPSRLLTLGSSIDRQPTYSPDGKRILFSSNRSGNLDLWITDRSSGALRQVTDDRAQDWDPAFTPDGGHVLWDSDRGGHLEVWTANTDGSEARQVTRDGLDAENPTETPDGKWILYWSGNAAKRGIWKIHPDGTGAERITPDDSVNTDVSPDGRYVLYIYQNRINLSNTIKFVEIESGRPLPFTIRVPFRLGSQEVIWGRARWSKDGRSVYFIGEDHTGLSGVFVQNFSPGEDTSATRRPIAGFSPEYVTESLGISPDGERLTISTGQEFTTIMAAENVPGAEPPRRSPK
ncbi:MAG: protein kinase domain-containing protein [Thermoanaerobaculia bacterium]